ncbi:MAG: hypothetical protein HKO53_03940, partial [Gemmatimonadetes bacterium]|nr:hypothetical protein [Gemmatimonadota bacterium]
MSSHLAFDCAAQSAIPEAECVALVALYNSTDGDGWVDNTGWLTAPDPCEWFGVGCLLGATVASVVLPANRLSGPLP